MLGLCRRGLAEWLIAACGIWQIGLGFYFIFLRPPLLPEDVRYIGTDLQALHAAAPHLADWLGKVFTVIGGFMAGTGMLVAFFAWTVMAMRPRWTTLVLAFVGAFTLLLMSAVNLALHSDFRWLLVVPPAVWAGAVAIYVVGERA